MREINCFLHWRKPVLIKKVKVLFRFCHLFRSYCLSLLFSWPTKSKFVGTEPPSWSWEDGFYLKEKKKNGNPTSSCSVPASQLDICNSCSTSSSTNDVRWTISDLSLVGSCPEGVHDISVFLGSGLSSQLEAFMFSEPLPVYGSPLSAPAAFAIQKGAVVQNWSCHRSIQFPSDAGSTFLENISKLFPNSPNVSLTFSALACFKR